MGTWKWAHGKETLRTLMVSMEVHLWVWVEAVEASVLGREWRLSNCLTEL